MRDARQPADTAVPAAPYSPVVVSGDLVFTAGQVAMRADGSIVDGGIEEQTRRVLDNVERCLAAADATLDDVVKVTVFVTDVRYREPYGEVRAEFFKNTVPASTLVQISNLAIPDALIEIEAVAVLDGGA